MADGADTDQTAPSVPARCGSLLMVAQACLSQNGYINENFYVYLMTYFSCNS